MRLNFHQSVQDYPDRHYIVQQGACDLPGWFRNVVITRFKFGFYHYCQNF